VAVDDLWMLPFAIGVASFAIQSHIGLALESVALLLVALAAMIGRGVRTPAAERRDYWVRVGKAVGVAAVVFAVLWLPVAYGTFVRGDGNVEKIFRFFTGDHQTAGFTTALEVLGLQWGPRPEWFLGARGHAILGNAFLEPRWWLAVWLVLGAGAVAIAVRRRSFATLWFGVVTGVGLVAALVAVSNIVGLVFPYLNRWTWVLGAALGILVLQGAWVLVPEARRAAVLRAALPVAVVVIGVIAVVETVDAIDAGTPYADAQRRERAITEQVLANLPAGDGPVLVDTSKGGLVAPGIALQLERHGIPVEVRPSQPVVYGRWRSSEGGGPYRAELTVVLGDEEIQDFERVVERPGRRIAHYLRRRTAADRAITRRFLREASETPPSAERDAFLDVARRSQTGPAEEIAVYLADPTAPD
jgi:hypothetical protein